jgi:hypothetical protein
MAADYNQAPWPINHSKMPRYFDGLGESPGNGPRTGFFLLGLPRGVWRGCHEIPRTSGDEIRGLWGRWRWVGAIDPRDERADDRDISIGGRMAWMTV